MLRVEFHCHTTYSKDSLTTPKQLLQACHRKGIQRIVVTDHNTIVGAIKAHQLNPELVIVGEEIMTLQGELLAAFVREEVPAGLSAIETITQLREQGAFISVSHPFDYHRKGSWTPEALEAIAPFVDAIETFNSRCILPRDNRLAQAFAERHNLPGTVGSDAHTGYEVGKATLLLPDFQTATDLRQVIRQAQPKVSLSSPWVHLSSRYAAWKKRLAR